MMRPDSLAVSLPKSQQSVCGIPRIPTLSLLLAGLVTLCGCSSIRVHLGLRVDLAKIPIASMEPSLPRGPAIAPGESSPLILTFTEPNGKILTTEGAGKGKVQWKDVAVAAEVVTVNKKGVLALRHDPRASEGKTGSVTIAVSSHPDLHAALVLPLRYDYPFTSTYAGTTGSSGSDGINGTDGSMGSAGSMDPDNPSAGGNGTDGSNGTDGTSGDNGGPGPDVTVQVTLKPGAHPMLQCSTTAGGPKVHYYLVDPQGGSLTITSAGGAGGSGGKGGKGGSGGSGGSGSPSGSNGSDGRSGNDGTSGFAGRDGQITVVYDPSVEPFLTAIRASNGDGPKPVFQKAPVSPLW